jgi:hypothetical protein
MITFKFRFLKGKKAFPNYKQAKDSSCAALVLVVSASKAIPE